MNDQHGGGGIVAHQTHETHERENLFLFSVSRSGFASRKGREGRNGKSGFLRALRPRGETNGRRIIDELDAAAKLDKSSADNG
jgi:hypothetical protein